MSTRPTVYLAGPITGLDYAGAVDWREHVKNVLSLHEIDAYSPMRGKEFLSHVKKFSPLGEPYDGRLSVAAAITVRDHWDCRGRDLIFVNMLGAKEKSIGTIMEVAWAYAYRRPCVLLMEDKGNPHDHAMFTEAATFRFATMEEGLNAVRSILLP